MIIDGSRGWYWYLKSLPEKIRRCDVSVRFNLIEREIGDRLCDELLAMVGTGVVGGVIACDIEDSDTLLGILFDESLKSKCIAAIDGGMGNDEVIYVNIFLVQGAEGYTNIDEDVLGSFAKVFQK